MTRGENSHNPSLSPDGSRLAVRAESPDPCPDPIYGQILIGKIRVLSRVDDADKDLTTFDCDLFYDTPRWIDDRTLLAVRVTKDAEETCGRTWRASMAFLKDASAGARTAISLSSRARDPAQM